jgi:hypothetical protein
MTRDEIRQSTRCPKCGAPPGMRCIEAGRYRDTIHPARVMAAETAAGWKATDPVAPASKAKNERRRRKGYERRR